MSGRHFFQFGHDVRNLLGRLALLKSNDVLVDFRLLDERIQNVQDTV